MRKKRHEGIVLVGDNAEMKALFSQVKHPAAILGVFYDSFPSPSPSVSATSDALPVEAEFPHQGGVSDVPSFLQANAQVRTVYCATANMETEKVQAIVQACKLRAVKFCAVLPMVNELNVPFRLSREHQQLVLASKAEPLACFCNRLLKRTSDLLASLLVLLTAFPVVFLVKFILARRHRLGSTIRTQRCFGPDGKEFRRFTFRPLQGNESVGIDAFPQIMNVFVGDMSLVGPAPLPAHSVSAFERANMKAGMLSYSTDGQETEASQHSGASGFEDQAHLAAEIWYAEHWSPWLDLRVLLRHFWGRK